MDKTSVFFGMTDREMAMLVMGELRSRELYGCLFLFPSSGGASVFASSTPEGSMTGLCAEEQLRIFAEVTDKRWTCGTFGERTSPRYDSRRGGSAAAKLGPR